MQLDWSTLLLEVINFLVLVWILKRFLYKPVLDAIARRKASIDKTLSDAQAKQADAKTLEQQYQNRLSDWEQEKDGLRRALTGELQVQRERLTEELQSALAKEREKETVLAERRLAELETRASQKGSLQGVQFTERLLERIACAEVEARLVKVALDDLPHLPDAQKEALRSASTRLPAGDQSHQRVSPAREAAPGGHRGAQERHRAGRHVHLSGRRRLAGGRPHQRRPVGPAGQFAGRTRVFRRKGARWCVNETVPASARPEWLDRYRLELRVTEQGAVRSVGDGIARIDGLPSASMEELLRFEDGSRGLVYSLEEDSVSAILFEQSDTLASGSAAFLTGQRLGIPVGDALLGRVIGSAGRSPGQRGGARMHGLAPAGSVVAAHRRAGFRQRAAVHREQDRRYPDPHRQGAAAAGDRRQRAGQELLRDRYGDQSEGQGRSVRLCAGGAKALDRGEHHRDAAKRGRFGIHHRRGRGGHRPRGSQVSGSVRRMRRVRGLDGAGQRHPDRL